MTADGELIVVDGEVIIIRLLQRLPYVAVFALVWLILNESFAWQQILIGLLVASVVMAFTNSQLLFGDYARLYAISILTVTRYCFYLILQIYQSGLMAIIRIIRGHDAVQINGYASTLRDDLSLTLLANAITLTPGTVTVSLEDHELQILSFDPLPPLKGKPITDNKRSIQKIEKILEPQRK